MPQCAVIGWPGQVGHSSWAALSQTVKTKSSRGASSPSNSLQLFERSPSIGWPRSSSSSSAIGWTAPWGRLPALKARKRPAPSRSRIASARMLRAELPVQRKSVS